MRKLIVIPARYGSSRFEGKPLALIAGVPMIIHVCKRLKGLLQQGYRIIVATDDQRIKEVVLDYGYETMLTGECKTGTDRVYEVAKRHEAEIYINVQGDEPLVDPYDIINIAEAKLNDMGRIIGSMTFLEEGEMENPDIVKVKVNDTGVLETITRKPINTIFRQCGIYAFTFQQLKSFSESKNMIHENIELTKVCNGVRMVLIGGGIAVDRPEDIKKIELAIQGRKYLGGG